ncbi:uncharacterized protein BDZ99DRAFT_572535 [Mytilinidion resinicola]|uniref:Uncharacterized protein n=1 Tax=Mytilinidion resinicola TaxID=574789 RepID=A0A6A6YFV2_9PEZI|nr:uncharacterized protein BDZ99DRAFT_572535 [Mytilinidion resinicola]KAF2807620.1 hypothetical protein BDZ99DRAFT_572535 [Mytilinidion resinicola]
MVNPAIKELMDETMARGNIPPPSKKPETDVATDTKAATPPPTLADSVTAAVGRAKEAVDEVTSSAATAAQKALDKLEIGGEEGGIVGGDGVIGAPLQGIGNSSSETAAEEKGAGKGKAKAKAEEGDGEEKGVGGQENVGRLRGGE